MSDGLSLFDRARIEMAIRRLDWRLDARVSDARRREIRNDLRSNLAVSAEQNGAAEAVRQLGPVKELSQEYLEAYSSGLRIKMAAVATLLTAVAVFTVSIALNIAFREGYVAAGGTGTWEYSWGPGPVRLFEGSGDAAKLAFGVVIPPIWLLLEVLVFVVPGRLWRFRRN